MSPIVQSRIALTLGYMLYGLGVTAGMVYALRQNVILSGLNPTFVAPFTILIGAGTMAIDYFD